MSLRAHVLGETVPKMASKVQLQRELNAKRVHRCRRLDDCNTLSHSSDCAIRSCTIGNPQNALHTTASHSPAVSPPAVVTDRARLAHSKPRRLIASDHAHLQLCELATLAAEPP